MDYGDINIVKNYVNHVKIIYFSSISKKCIKKFFLYFGKIKAMNKICRCEGGNYVIITYDNQESGIFVNKLHSNIIFIVENVMEIVNGVEMNLEIDNKIKNITFFVSKNCLHNISCARLKLSNLPSNTTEFILYDMLKKKYSILSLCMTRNDKNERIGIADIEFEKKEDCKKCYKEMKGMTMNGCIIDAEIAMNNNNSE